MSQKAVALPSPENLPALIDEFGALDAEIALLKPKIRRHEELRKLFQSKYQNEAAELSFFAHGDKFSILISERENERKVTSMRPLYKILGLAHFLSVCSIPLKLIDKITTPEEQTSFIEKTRTGHRTITAVMKP